MACGNWGMQAAVLASLILVFAQKFLRVFHFIQLVINSLCIIHWTRTEWTRTASWIQSYIFEFFHSFCPWNFSQLAWTVSAGFSWLRKCILLLFSFFFFLNVTCYNIAVLLYGWDQNLVYYSKAVLIASNFSCRGHHYINERLFQTTATISMCFVLLFLFVFLLELCYILSRRRCYKVNRTELYS